MAPHPTAASKLPDVRRLVTRTEPPVAHIAPTTLRTIAREALRSRDGLDGRNPARTRCTDGLLRKLAELRDAGFDSVLGAVPGAASMTPLETLAEQCAARSRWLRRRRR